MATVETLLTAEEFGLLPEDGRLSELVRGRIVPVNMPYPRHGEICVNVVLLIGNHVTARQLGRIVSNDSGVVTERDPDTVRGADVAYYSYERVPKGPLPRRKYLDVAPDLAIEVRSPGDPWSEVLAKVAEYLRAGVKAVVVLDEQTRTLTIYRPDVPHQVLNDETEFSLPDILGDFRVAVGRLFE